MLADGHGNVIHLGERECSLQRRHQKIVEEAPTLLLDEATRAAMGEAAVQAARSCGYRGAGTVEFIVRAATRRYYFMEMNTRLQVEHPVTELVTGLDLVEWQLRVAAGEPLPFGQEDVRLTGHAVEARVCAEDPARGFLPSGGTVLRLHEPQGDGVRTDSGLSEGAEVGSLYDPMLSKVIAYGPDRESALRKLRAALADTVTLGVQTNAGFLRRLLAHPAVVAGEQSGDVGHLHEGATPAAWRLVSGAGTGSSPSGLVPVPHGHDHDDRPLAQRGGVPGLGHAAGHVLGPRRLEDLQRVAAGQPVQPPGPGTARPAGAAGPAGRPGPPAGSGWCGPWPSVATAWPHHQADGVQGRPARAARCRGRNPQAIPAAAASCRAST